MDEIIFGSLLEFFKRKSSKGLIRDSKRHFIESNVCFELIIFIIKVLANLLIYLAMKIDLLKLFVIV